MILSKKDRYFLKVNRKFLESLFNRRIEDLKESVFNMKSEDRDLEIRFIKEYKTWLSIINIVSSEKEEKKDTGI